jgi:DNA-binding SARP family transcriptional activator/tetratricopeptide (TPR) repeat protein
VLGPVGAWRDGDELDAGPPKRRAILALLAMRLDSVVTASQLVDFVWDDDPPPHARRIVTVHMSRLRSVLTVDKVSVETVSAGYILKAPPVSIDAHRFRMAVTHAETLSDAATRSAVLHDALALWRGTALSGITATAASTPIAAGLDRLRLVALERRIRADLELDRHSELHPELAELVAAHPTHEAFSTALMIAAWRCGQRAEALDEYERLRYRLADDLGIEPGPEAQSVFGEILRADPAVMPRPAAADRGPCHLPAAVGVFEGRTAQLAALDDALTGVAGTPIAVISGMGGVGKTAIAVTWAYSAAVRYPDGQFYVDLRGYDGRRPLTPIEALTRLLAAAGVAPTDVPTDLDAAAGCYRATLADKRVIVVLDNARSAAQVRELLPSGRGNVVVVTSRDSLTGLVVQNDARTIPIGVLDPGESAALFTRLFTRGRREADPATIELLGDVCGHLPLAIRILAANLVTDRSVTPEAAAEALRHGARLTALEVADDPASALGLVFAHSYGPLDPSEQRVFRLLGAAPCVDYTVESAAAIAGIGHADAAHILDRLVAANVVTEIGADRFGFHDLIRELATECNQRDEPADERRTADDRLIAWYIGLGVAAHAVVNPHLPPVRPDVAFVDAAYPFGTDSVRAIIFVDAETANLLAVARYAGACGRDADAWHIPAALFNTLDHGRSLPAALDLATEAVEIALRLGDGVAERRARINLGVFYNNARRPTEALQQLERGVVLAREQSERRSEGIAYSNMAVAYKALNDVDGYLTANLTAAELLPGNSPIMNNLGNAYCNRGDYDLARSCLDHGLAYARANGDRANEALSLGNLGYLELTRGHPGSALDFLQAGYALAADIGFARLQVNVDVDLAETHARLGRPEQRRFHLERALKLAESSGNTGRERDIRRLLAGKDILVSAL